MAIIRINDLPVDNNPSQGDFLAVDGATTRKATVLAVANAGAPIASQAEAQAGTDPAKRMTPLTTKQAIDVFAVPINRQVTAGNGLTGGGPLSSNITLALSSTSLTSLGKADTAVQPARTISAGTGLTGGGDLSANRTISLSAATQASLMNADTAVQHDDPALMPAGGATGEVLVKNSDNDYDIGWEAIAAATAVSYAPQSLTAPQQQQARENIGVLLAQANGVATLDATGNVPTAQLLNVPRLVNYETRAAVAAATIPGSYNYVRTAGYVLAGDLGGGLYKRVASEPSHAGKVQSADGAWWELATNEADPRKFGGIVDAADNTQPLLDTFAYAKAKNVPIKIPSGVWITAQPLPIFHWMQLSGEGAFGRAVLQQKDGANMEAVLLGETSLANWNLPANDDEMFGDNFWTIQGIDIDGNMANNTAGYGIRLFGRRFTLRDVFITNVPYHGMWTKFSGGSIPRSMEALYENISIDTCGRHGWRNEGPHDSMIVGVNTVDCSLSAHNVYSGFSIGAGGNGRFVACHSWQRGIQTNRMRCALSQDADGGSCSFDNSHFEGAYTANVSLSGQACQFGPTCMYYAAWNGQNILVTSPSHTIMGRLGDPGAGRPACKGVVLGFSPEHNCTNIIISLTTSNQGAGVIDWNASKGANIIDIVGFQPSGVFMVGTPNATDICRIRVSGAAGGSIFQPA